MATATKTKPAAGAKGGAEDGEEAPKGKKKLLVIIVAAVLVLAIGGGAAWFFLLKPKGEPAAEPEPVPGAVLVMDPISVNLAGGHYLRIGIALQLTDAVAEDPDGSHALDLTITTFTNQDPAALADPAQREALRQTLLTEVEHAYEKEVMDVYFTEFVTQ